MQMAQPFVQPSTGKKRHKDLPIIFAEWLARIGLYPEASEHAALTRIPSTLSGKLTIPTYNDYTKILVIALDLQDSFHAITTRQAAFFETLSTQATALPALWRIPTRRLLAVHANRTAANSRIHGGMVFEAFCGKK